MLQAGKQVLLRFYEIPLALIILLMLEDALCIPLQMQIGMPALDLMMSMHFVMICSIFLKVVTKNVSNLRR